MQRGNGIAPRQFGEYPQAQNEKKRCTTQQKSHSLMQIEFDQGHSFTF
jgi:hypothetical protein